MDSFTFTRFIQGAGFDVEIDCIESNVVKYRILHEEDIADKLSYWHWRSVEQFIPLARFWSIQNNHG